MKKKGFFEKLLGKSSDEEEGELYRLNGQGKEMIRGIVKLSDTMSKEVMVPRTDVVFIPVDSPMKEVLRILTDCGHSRVPVFRDTIDNVIGILYAKDLLRFLLNGEEKFDINSIIRKPFRAIFR